MQEHGSFELKVRDSTFITKAFGAWNYETSIRYSKESKQLASSLIYRPWASLVDLSEWELGTPDIWEVIDELNTWANANNLKYEVVICSLSLQKTMLEMTHEKLTNINTRFFDNLEQAYEYLESVGVVKI